MCCPCCKSICCRIINAAIVFFFFAGAALGALDMAFLFKRWQVYANVISNQTSAGSCTPTPFTKDNFSSFALHDWFTMVPVGLQVNNMQCTDVTTAAGGVVNAGTTTTVVCQFSQIGDALIYVAKHGKEQGTKYTNGTTTYFQPCYGIGTYLNIKLVYIGYAMCAVGLAIAIFVPIAILACGMRS